MKTPLAWLNLTHQKKRTLVAVIGVGFAALLIFMQLGFYGAAEGTATIIYDQLDFDVILLSPQYIDVNRAGNFPASRVQQALATDGVADAAAVRASFGGWRNADAPPQFAGRPQTMMVIGLRPEAPVFRRDGRGIQLLIDEHRGELTIPGRALIDSRSHAEFGRFDVGQEVEMGPQRIKIAGQFTLGTGFGANGLILVGDGTFFRIWPEFPRDRVSLGLVRLAPGADPDEVVRRLNAKLPGDVQAITRDELGRRERTHWVEQTSIGLIFKLGVGVALFVGVVFVYQVIASDIANRLGEYATLKAVGYGPMYLAGVVMQQAAFIAALGYFPGLAGSLILYSLARGATGIPIAMDLTRAVLVFGLTVAMCSISGFLALRKVQSADPAELF